MMNMNETDFKHDHRYRNAYCPEQSDIVAAYGARWIDRGGWVEIVPDRQGFAYNDIADRNELGDLVKQVIADMEKGHKGPKGQTIPWLAVGSDKPYQANGGSIGWSYRAYGERRGGYIHVEVWLCRP